MSNYNEYLSNLRNRVWKTYGSRLEACRRLSLRERLSSYCIALLSAIGLVVGIFSLTQSDLVRTQYGVSLGIGISLIVLVISLLEAAGSYGLRAERLHRNAIDLGETHSRISQLCAQSPSESDEAWRQIRRLEEEYERSVRECAENQAPIDFYRFVVRHRHSEEFADQKLRGFWGSGHAAWIVVRHLFSAIGFPIIFAAVIIAATAFQLRGN